MSEQARITMRRATGCTDLLRAYKVMVDGAMVASVRRDESITIPISSGSHSLKLRIDWCGSEQIDFDVQPGEHVFFECGGSLTVWQVPLAFFYIMLRPNRYLWLRRVAERG